MIAAGSESMCVSWIGAPPLNGCMYKFSAFPTNRRKVRLWRSEVPILPFAGFTGTLIASDVEGGSCSDQLVAMAVPSNV
jgi:hypothetical protein